MLDSHPDRFGDLCDTAVGLVDVHPCVVVDGIDRSGDDGLAGHGDRELGVMVLACGDDLAEPEPCIHLEAQLPGHAGAANSPEGLTHEALRPTAGVR